MKRVSQDAVRNVVEALMKEQRTFKIEYSGFFSNHITWIVIPHLRLGKAEHEVRQLVDQYNEKVKTEPVSDTPRPIEQSELDTMVTSTGANYATLLKYFDEKVSAAVTEKGLEAGLADVCNKHLKRVSIGICGAAFHPILELGVGIECSSPSIVANGLAYLHSRSWKEYDMGYTSVNNSPGDNPLLSTLRTWGSQDLSAVFPEAFEKASKLELGYGNFQHRLLAMLTTVPVFKTHAVAVPPEDSLLRCLEELLVFAAVALPLSGSDFFVLHGFTSLWSLYNLIRKVPLEYEVQADLVASWMRGYFACYLAQDTPCKWYLPLVMNNIRNDLPKVLTTLKKFDHVEAPSWDCAVTTASPQEDEHVLKAVWMMMEIAMREGATAEEKEVLLYAANIVAAHEAPIRAVREASNPPVRIRNAEAKYLATQYGTVWANGAPRSEFDALFASDVVLRERPYAQEGSYEGVDAVHAHWDAFLKERMVSDVALQSVMLDDDSNKAVAKWGVSMKSKVEGTDEWRDVKLTQVAVLKYNFDDVHGWRVCEAEEYWQNMPPEVEQFLKRKPTEAETRAVLEMRRKRQEELQKISLSEYSMR